MGHFKRTNANEIDKNTLNLEINIQKTKQHFVNSHGNKLKVPGQEVPDWHGQEKQAQWNEKPAHLPPAHQHRKAAQQQRNQRKLLQRLQTNQTTQPIAQKAKSKRDKPTRVKTRCNRVTSSGPSREKQGNRQQ